jgi:catechol 2,3-dioxygenase-like lactoylglutathione lyase family enzyme
LVKGFAHVTFVVRDLEAAAHFFGLLGFHVDVDVIISGGAMARYLGIEGLEARQVTLALAGSPLRQEIQLVQYIIPDAITDPKIHKLNKVGYSHVCLAVEDIQAEVAGLKAHGVKFRNDITQFHNRQLVYLYGPEGITLELAQWD